MHANDGYIEMARWGKDHWSTLAYVETVMVDNLGFQVGIDERMKSNRRDFRVMHECPRPKRARRLGIGPRAAVVMRPEHATKLNNGEIVDDHDDWCCVQDMAAAGLFTAGAEAVKPGVVLHFSTRGRHLANRLREHKANGGTFATFSASTQSRAA